MSEAPQDTVAGEPGRAAARWLADVRRRPAVSFALVGLVTALLWSPSLHNGFCADDVNLIVETGYARTPPPLGRLFTQPFLQVQAGGWRADYYRPVVSASYVLDGRLHGESARGFHLTNVILHAAVAALLAAFLFELGLGAAAAALGALLFGLHPALAEDVAWISGRTDILAALGMLAFLLLDRRRERLSWRGLSLAALTCALLSKETAVIAPLIAVGAALRYGEAPWSALRRRWDVLLVVLAWVGARAMVLGAAVTHGQAAIAGVAKATRAVAVPHLLGLLAVPWLGRVDYGVGLPAEVLIPGALVGIAVAGGLVAGFLRAQRGRPPGALLEPTALLIAAGVLAVAPLALATLVKATIAQRLLYTPALFLAPAAAALALRWRRSAWIVLVLVGFAWSAAALDRIPQWTSTRSLWQAAVLEPHASALAHANLAKGQHDEGQLDAALGEVDAALALAPSSVAYQLRAVIDTELGCNDLAVPDFRRSLAINAGDERTANNLASALAELHQYDEATAALSAFLTRFGGPEFLARSRARIEREKAAWEARPPDKTPPREPICGDPAAARARAADAEFLSRRAAQRLHEGIANQAWILVQAALRLDPALTSAQLTLARWYAQDGQVDLARGVLENILRREPDNVTARRWREQLAAPSSPSR